MNSNDIIDSGTDNNTNSMNIGGSSLQIEVTESANENENANIDGGSSLGIDTADNSSALRSSTNLNAVKGSVQGDNDEMGDMDAYNVYGNRYNPVYENRDVSNINNLIAI